MQIPPNLHESLLVNDLLHVTLPAGALFGRGKPANPHAQKMSLRSGTEPSRQLMTRCTSRPGVSGAPRDTPRRFRISFRTGGWRSCPEVGVGYRTGPEVVIPPPPQVKNGWGPPDPPFGSQSHTPCQGYLRGTPPPFSRHSFTSERLTGLSSGWGDPPIPPAFSG